MKFPVSFLLAPGFSDSVHIDPHKICVLHGHSDQVITVTTPTKMTKTTKVLSAVLAHLEDSQRQRVAEMLRSTAPKAEAIMENRRKFAVFFWDTLCSSLFQLRHFNLVTISIPLPTRSFARHGLSYWRQHRDMR